MLLGLQSEGVRVDAGVRCAGVVVEWLDLVEVLAVLLLEAVLAVQDHLELVQRTDLHALDQSSTGATRCVSGTLLDPAQRGSGRGGSQGTLVVNVRYAAQVRQNVVVGLLHKHDVGCNVHVRAVGAEVPHGVQLGCGAGAGVLVAPDQLLYGVVEAQTNQLGRALRASRRQLVTASVLNLLNQVLVTLLGEAATLLRVQVYVVGPDLESIGGAEVAGIVAGQVKVQTNLVVLQGNQGQVQAWVAVEEEQQRQVHTHGRQYLCRDAQRNGVGWGCHLAPCVLVRLAEEQLSVQTPPGLVMLVNALAANRQLNGADGTLSNPVDVEGGVCGRQNVGHWGQSNVHVANQVTIAGNGDGHAAAAGRAAVGRLLNQLHGEVRVALVHSLEERHLGVTGQVHILGTISYQLH